ncbi:hypothetical protein B0H65DRAFT_48374 [Neurospora tetraspora]|uniref:Uncharacterized protein n=1 Tax=Neurospora tetraspora TaxID=94610 RepID=A0AAE0JQ73_9PEZI|nr:hypothetical protein B0H65DRAFT_48374 [Neurospora tetraspora]
MVMGKIPQSRLTNCTTCNTTKGAPTTTTTGDTSDRPRGRGTPAPDSTTWDGNTTRFRFHSKTFIPQHSTSTWIFLTSDTVLLCPVAWDIQIRWSYIHLSPIPVFALPNKKNTSPTTKVTTNPSPLLTTMHHHQHHHHHHYCHYHYHYTSTTVTAGATTHLHYNSPPPKPKAQQNRALHHIENTANTISQGASKTQQNNRNFSVQSETY